MRFTPTQKNCSLLQRQVFCGIDESVFVRFSGPVKTSQKFVGQKMEEYPDPELEQVSMLNSTTTA